MRLTTQLTLGLALLPASLATAQTTLRAPDATSAESFSLIRGVLELKDGRVLVADWRDQRVGLLDRDLRLIRAVGRVGAGPAEYRLPGALLPWRGDSALLADQGNARFAVIAPEGRIVRMIRADRPGMVAPGGTDRAGRIYYAIPPWARGQGPTHPDSVRIARFDPASGREEPVAMIRGSTRPRDQGPRRTPSLPFVAFAPRDAFRVKDDGTVVVVRSGDYRVERVLEGRRSGGPANPWAREPVRQADRLAFVTDFLNGSAMSGRGPDGGMGLAPIPSQSELARMVESNEFAETLPPFIPAGVVLAPDGELWVERGRHAGEPAIYDRFDLDGVRTGQVMLDRGRTLLALGRTHLYVAVSDADGLQQLERYRRP